MSELIEIINSCKVEVDRVLYSKLDQTRWLHAKTSVIASSGTGVSENLDVF